MEQQPPIPDATPPPAGQAPEAVQSDLLEPPREALPKAASSDRLLWTGAGIAVIAHLLPFVYLGEPKSLGDGVLTEAIAVELIDAATLDGKDQTPPSKPSAATPPQQQAQPAPQTPPGPTQKAQKAIPRSPPPAPAVPPAQPAQAEPAQAPAQALPAFEGENDVSKASKKAATQKEPPKEKPAEEPPKQQPEQQQAKPQAPQPKRPPPQEAVAPRAPAAAPPQAAKPAPPRNASTPAQAKSGEVTKFNKEVVAALARAKPSAPGIKGSVTITVVVNYGGGVRLAKIAESSGREDLDKLALEAAKQAKVPPPPPDASTDDYFYDVEYKFE